MISGETRSMTKRALCLCTSFILLAASVSFACASSIAHKALGQEVIITSSDEAKFLQAFRNGEDGTVINLSGQVVTVRGEMDEFLSNSHNITVKNGTLALRFGGIVCGGDLTLQDIDLNFTSTTASGCALVANGHTLNINNVDNTNANVNAITIFGGGVANSQYDVPSIGNWSSSTINIDGKNNLGKIFMGTFDAMKGGTQSTTACDFSSCVVNVSENCKQISADRESRILYACGGYPASRTNFVADANKYPITLNAVANVYEDLFSTIEGETGRNLKAIVNFNGGQYAIDTLTLHTIREINVKSGKLKLKDDTSFGPTYAKIALGVASGATLYAGDIGNKTFTYFNGGGTLNLGKSKNNTTQTIKINDAVTGSTSIEFGNVANFRYPGVVDNIYIDAPKSSSNSFVIDNKATGQQGFWTRNASGQWLFSSTQPSAHEHKYGEYHFDENEHWLQCEDAGCPDVEGSKIGIAAHEFEDDHTRKCTYCGYKRVVINDIFEPKDDSKLEKLKARVFNGILHSRSTIDVSDIGISGSEIVYTTSDGTSLSGESAVRQMTRDNPFFSTLAITGIPTFTKSGNIVNSVGVTFSQYTWKPETISLALEAYEEVMAKVNKNMTVVQKLAIVHDWICAHIDYSLNAQLADFALGALANGKAVCAGYAQCFQFLITQLGIENVYLSADTPKEPHAWNLVKVDGYWFHIDTTWDDGVAGSTGYHHSFFLLNDDEFLASGDDDGDGIGTHGRAWLDQQKYPTNTKAYFDNKFWEGISGELSAESLKEDPKLTVTKEPDPTPDPDPKPDPDPDPVPDPKPEVKKYNVELSKSGDGIATINSKRASMISVEHGKSVNVIWKPTTSSSDVNLPSSITIKMAGKTIFAYDITNDKKVKWKEQNQYWKKRMKETKSYVSWKKMIEGASSSFNIKSISGDVKIQIVFQKLTPVYRMYNMITSEHLFTSQKSEYDKFASLCNSGADYWIPEGIDWLAPSTATGHKKVYRLYNAGLGRLARSSHYYTTDESEAKTLVKKHGWKYDFGGKAAFYSGGTQAIYTCYNEALGSAHHYTSSYSEYSGLKKHGWDLEVSKNKRAGKWTGFMNCIASSGGTA